jgi:minichromosome maintenance protein 10
VQHIPNKQPNKPSTVLDKLASLNPSTSIAHERSAERSRTTAFEQPAFAPEAGPSVGIKRDDNLAIIEDLQMGPYGHPPLVDDPEFNTLEPHSGIRLS